MRQMHVDTTCIALKCTSLHGQAMRTCPPVCMLHIVSFLAGSAAGCSRVQPAAPVPETSRLMRHHLHSRWHLSISLQDAARLMSITRLHK